MHFSSLDIVANGQSSVFNGEDLDYRILESLAHEPVRHLGAVPEVEVVLHVKHKQTFYVGHMLTVYILAEEVAVHQILSYRFSHPNALL